MAATMKQIASIAGVSIGTVDRALKDKGRVAPEVAKRIKEIAKQLDYHPNTIAKSLVNKNKNITIGVITHIKPNRFYSEVMQGIENAAREIADYNVTVRIAYGSEFNHEIQLEQINKMINEGISALAIVPIDHPVIESRLSELQEQGLPIFFLGAFLDNVRPMAYIGTDYEKAGRIGAGLLHLLAADNKANVLAFSPTLNMFNHKKRIESLDNTLKERYPNIRLKETIELIQSPFQNYVMVRDILEENNDIDFIFTTSQQYVIEAIGDTIKETGRDIKVIAIDYNEFAKKGMQDGFIVATISQQPELQGYRCIHMIFDYLVKDMKPETEEYFTELRILINESLED